MSGEDYDDDLGEHILWVLDPDSESCVLSCCGCLVWFALISLFFLVALGY